MEHPPLPTFIVIGAQKSATRWLMHNLQQHPDVFMLSPEQHFFDHEEPTETAIERYRANFSEWGGQQEVGEVTPGYLFWRNRPDRVAARIDTALPDVKLLAVLRNPVDRALSAFNHHMQRGRIGPDEHFVDWVESTPPDDDRLGVVSGGWYAASLEPYMRLFDHRVEVLLNDDITDDAEAAYLAACRHLRVRDFVPGGLTERRHTQGPVVGSTLDDGSGKLRRLSDDERRRVFRLFANDVDRLEGLIGRGLTRWRPGG